jgi:hypothetical protein
MLGGLDLCVPQDESPQGSQWEMGAAPRFFAMSRRPRLDLTDNLNLLIYVVGTRTPKAGKACGPCAGAAASALSQINARYGEYLIAAFISRLARSMRPRQLLAGNTGPLLRTCYTLLVEKLRSIFFPLYVRQPLFTNIYISIYTQNTHTRAYVCISERYYLYVSQA